MYIPETGKQIGALQVDHFIPLAGRRAMTAQHFDDPSVLHGHAGTGDWGRPETIDQVCIGQDEPHGRIASRIMHQPSGLKGPCCYGTVSDLQRQAFASCSKR